MKDAIKSSPGLAGMVILAWMFLRAQGRRDKTLEEVNDRNRELVERISGSFQDMHEEHIAARNESRLIITKCTEILGEVVISMHNMSESVNKCQMLRESTHGKNK